jgi:hypothetical protein
MSDAKPGPIINQCSPEYRSRCVEWALELNSRSMNKTDAAEVVSAAKLFYDYVYENK